MIGFSADLANPCVHGSYRTYFYDWCCIGNYCNNDLFHPNLYSHNLTRDQNFESITDRGSRVDGIDTKADVDQSSDSDG